MVYRADAEQLSVFNGRYRRQVVATLAVQIMTFAHGVGVGWLAPSLLSLTSDESPLPRPISVSEASWVGSLVGIGALVGNVFFGLLMDRLGRKLCMFLLAIPNIVFWVLIYAAQDVTYLYAGRFLAGVAGGGCYVVLPIFVAEICDSNIRGALSSVAMMYLSGGIIVGFILTTYLSYSLMPSISILIPIIYLLSIITLPEPAQNLLRKGRDEQARKSYYYYKNLPDLDKPDSESARDEAALKQFETFRQQVLSGGVREVAGWKDFFNLPTIKTFGLCFTLLICNQLAGCFALFSYTSQIFSELHTKVAPNICTIIVGAMQVLGILCTILLSDRMGRRRMLLSSILGMGICELGIGLLKQLATEEFLIGNSWLALLLMCLVAFVASLGLIPLVFVIVIELLPAKIRSVGTSLCMALMSIFIFISLKIYPMLMYGPGLAVTMYMSAASCGIAFIVLGLYLPETNGKQLTN